VVIHVLPIPARSDKHLLDDDAGRALVVRAHDVGVLALIALVQISWLSLLVYGAKSLFW
jgi:hypothetical protein